MKRRDTIVLVVAVVCGILAFSLVMKVLKKSSQSATSEGIATEGNAKGPLPIPSGMSALTLYSKDVENMPNALGIGSYVDVLGMMPNYEDKMELQTIVRSAQVVNLDKKEGVSGIDSITIVSTPAGAEVATKAMAQGKIHLIHRPDGAGKGSFQFNGIGVTEVIRGVEKDKSVHVDK